MITCNGYFLQTNTDSVPFNGLKAMHDRIQSFKSSLYQLLQGRPLPLLDLAKLAQEKCAMFVQDVVAIILLFKESTQVSFMKHAVFAL